MNDAGGSSRAGSRRRWLIMVGSLWLLGAVAVYWLHGWLLGEIVAQAERRGVLLSGCQLDLGLSSVAIEGCGFRLRPDGRVFSSALTNVAVSGDVERIEVELSGLTPSRMRVHGARAAAWGEPRLRELLGSASSSVVPSLELPVDVVASALSWQLEKNGPALLSASELSFDAASSRLLSRFEIVRRAHGQLSLGPEGVEITLGDPARPEVRLIVRVLPKAERAEISLDLRRVPLRSLEGPWLQMTETLRPVELEGRIFASIPLGLSMDPPAGDLHLTLHGLQFPIPRELEGLIYQSPPKLSGKFTLSRTFDRATIADLSFLAGELAMRGDAKIEVRAPGLAIESKSSGPLSCRSIADAAATAHADSPLAALTGRFASRVLTGSVDVFAAIDAVTSDLEHAKVFTSIGVGCGLQPLPFDASVPKELLDRFPLDAFSPLPIEPEVRLPRLRIGKSRTSGLPTFELPRTPARVR